MQRPTKARRLTLRQRKFVAAYIGPANGNGTQAAKMAGYPDKRASTAAWQQLKKPHVAAAIEASRPCIDPLPINRAKEIATREDRQVWLTKVMLGQVAEVDVKDQLKACEILCRMQGDFIEHRIVEDRREAAKLTDEELYAKVRDKVLEQEGITRSWQSN